MKVPYRRAIAVFRISTLAYAAALILRPGNGYAHPAGAWAVMAVMAGWTAFATYAYAHPVPPVRTGARGGGRAGGTGGAREAAPAGPGRFLRITDLGVAAGCALATWWVQTPEHIAHGARTLTVSWVVAPVLVWAVTGGKRGGAVAAAVLAAADAGVHLGHGLSVTPSVFNSAVLLFLTGVIVGHVAELAADAERRLAQAIEMEAARRERDRLARDIHDSVLQVLTLVQRRGAELGGEAAELGRLAGEQEAALRTLVRTGEWTEQSDRAGQAAAGEADLCDLLMPHSSTSVTVSTPATPVRMPAGTARELAAAVAAALDNVRRHCPDGTKAWILVEEDDDAVAVSVRDDGPGIAEGRLESAEADGRLGVAQSIRGRVRDLGGAVLITSTPGQGTEVELRVPLV